MKVSFSQILQGKMFPIIRSKFICGDVASQKQKGIVSLEIINTIVFSCFLRIKYYNKNLFQIKTPSLYKLIRILKTINIQNKIVLQFEFKWFYFIRREETNDLVIFN